MKRRFNSISYIKRKWLSLLVVVLLWIAIFTLMVNFSLPNIQAIVTQLFEATIAILATFITTTIFIFTVRSIQDTNNIRIVNDIKRILRPFAGMIKAYRLGIQQLFKVNADPKKVYYLQHELTSLVKIEIILESNTQKTADIKNEVIDLLPDLDKIEYSEDDILRAASFISSIIDERSEIQHPLVREFKSAASEYIGSYYLSNLYWREDWFTRDFLGNRFNLAFFSLVSSSAFLFIALLIFPWFGGVHLTPNHNPHISILLVSLVITYGLTSIYIGLRYFYLIVNWLRQEKKDTLAFKG